MKSARLVLYSVSLSIFILAQIIDDINPLVANRLVDLWIFSMVAICIDYLSQIRFSKYSFFPFLLSILLLYRYLEMPYAAEISSYQNWLYLPLSILFALDYFKYKMESRDIKTMLIILSVGCLITFSQMLLQNLEIPTIQRFLHLGIQYYLILALTGQALLANAFHSDEVKKLQPTALFMLFWFANILSGHFFGQVIENPVF